MDGKNGFDKVQLHKRNRIGKQMFLIMFFSVFLTAAIYNGFGVRLGEYPTNILIIALVCMVIYMVRLIAAKAYLPSTARVRDTIIPFAIVLVISLFLNSPITVAVVLVLGLANTLVTLIHNKRK